MKCIHPIYLKKEKILVPCGQCTFCKIMRSKDWSTRILHECGYWEDKIFITLTYDDDNLPENNSLSKKDLKDFIKKIRKASKKKLKVYGCGEYGDITKRPHMHLIIFGLSEKFFQHKYSSIYESKYWGKGDIHIGSVSYDSARYTADYCQKKYYGTKALETYYGMEQPFQVYSQGIGKQWALDNQEYLKQKLGCTVDGREVGLCKYYRRILEIDGKDVYEENKKRGHKFPKTVEEFLERKWLTRLRMGLPNSEETIETMQKIYNQRKKNFDKSLALRRKK